MRTEPKDKTFVHLPSNFPFTRRLVIFAGLTLQLITANSVLHRFIAVRPQK